MKPCMVRCVDCNCCIEYLKRIKCSLGRFDVQYHEGLLLVPFDFECVDFVRKAQENVKEAV